MLNTSRPSEKIVCAAIWYKELPTAPANGCKNIDKGIVIFGLRHGHVISLCRTLTGKRTVTFAEDGVGEHEQGFLTTENRFVDREEGWIIAEREGQLIGCSGGKGTLYSEDLY